ncbi:hypothetical protein B0H14DRAFT_2258664, partial [Mycena olivaceomarginata]
LDFALVCTGEKNERTEGTALEGPYQRSFQLPQMYGLRTAHPLAYIERYTPFGVPDPVTGLFTVRPSTRNNHIYG